jgi:hypothetical protein
MSTWARTQVNRHIQIHLDWQVHTYYKHHNIHNSRTETEGTSGIPSTDHHFLAMLKPLHVLDDPLLILADKNHQELCRPSIFHLDNLQKCFCISPTDFSMAKEEIF